jgi:hypothetical protein
MKGEEELQVIVGVGKTEAETLLQRPRSQRQFSQFFLPCCNPSRGPLRYISQFLGQQIGTVLIDRFLRGKVRTLEV